MAITSRQRLLLEQKLDQTSDMRKWQYLCAILAYDDGFEPHTISSILNIPLQKVQKFIRHSKKQIIFKLICQPLIPNKKDRLG